MCCDEIKRSMINPLLIFEHVMGIPLPDESVKYSSTIYMTFSELFDMLFDNADMSYVNGMLSDKGITDDMLEKMVKNKRKAVQWFCQIMEVVLFDVLKIQRHICYILKDDDKINELKSDYGKLLPMLAIDETVLSSEIMEEVLFVDQEYADKISAIISVSMSNIVDALLYPEKGSEIMSKTQYANDVITELDYDENGDLVFNVLAKDKIGIDDSQQKRTARELRKNVNYLDEESGLNLYEPTRCVETEEDLFEAIMNYRVILTEMILALNGVDGNKYIDTHTIFSIDLRRLKVNSKFKDKSRLFNNIKYGINERGFASRFLTYLYSWVIKYLDVIADKCYKINDDGQFIELDAKLSYVEQVVTNLSKLTSALLTGVPCSDYLLFFNEIQIYLNTNKKNHKKNMKKIDNIYLQGDILSHNLRRFSGSSSDVNMDTLLKLSYLVCVNSPNARNVVEFCEGYKFKRNSNTQYLIESLGIAVIEDSKKYGLQKMFKFFIDSDPEILTSNNQQSAELVVGILSLKYYSFLVDDNRVDRILKKII